MKIIRKFEDGTELNIQLTDEEVYLAYHERSRNYDMEDLITKLAIMTDENDPRQCADDAEFEIGQRTVTGKQLKELLADESFMNIMIDEFRDNLENNDSFWELFWCTAESVIEEMIADRVPKSEKELRREANQEKYKTLIDEIQRSSLSHFTQSEIIDRLINYVGEEK